MAKNALHLLITSLNSGEKRYFKNLIARSKKKEDKIYLLLFNAIANQEEYDEGSIKKLFSEKSFVKHFAVTKNYVFNAILKSLRFNHNEETIDGQLSNLIAESDILVKRTLYQEASKKLLKALEVSEKYEKFGATIDICMLMYQFISNRTAFTGPEDQLDIHNSITSATQKASELAEYRNFSYKCSQAYHSNNSESDKIKMYRSLLQDLLMADNADLHSFRAKTTYHNTRGALYYWIGESDEKAFQENKQIVDLFVEHPEFLSELRAGFLAGLNNLLTNLSKLKKPDLFEKYMRILESQTSQYPDDEIRIFGRIVMLKMEYYLRNCMFREQIRYAIETESEIKKRADKLADDVLMAIYVNFSMAFFIDGQYVKSRKYINSIFQHEPGPNWETAAFVNMLNLFIEYENDDPDYFEYLFGRTKKFILKKRRLDNCEKYILDFFHSYLTYAGDERKNRASLQQLIQELDAELQKDPDALPNISVFNIPQWARAKLAKKSYTQQMLDFYSAGKNS